MLLNIDTIYIRFLQLARWNETLIEFFLLIPRRDFIEWVNTA
jgi:hypothetical protein